MGCFGPGSYDSDNALDLFDMDLARTQAGVDELVNRMMMGLDEIADDDIELTDRLGVILLLLDGDAVIQPEALRKFHEIAVKLSRDQEHLDRWTDSNERLVALLDEIATLARALGDDNLPDDPSAVVLNEILTFGLQSPKFEPVWLHAFQAADGRYYLDETNENNRSRKSLHKSEQELIVSIHQRIGELVVAGYLPLVTRKN